MRSRLLIQTFHDIRIRDRMEGGRRNVRRAGYACLTGLFSADDDGNAFPPAMFGGENDRAFQRETPRSEHDVDRFERIGFSRFRNSLFDTGKRLEWRLF